MQNSVRIRRVQLAMIAYKDHFYDNESKSLWYSLFVECDATLYLIPLSSKQSSSFLFCTIQRNECFRKYCLLIRFKCVVYLRNSYFHFFLSSFPFFSSSLFFLLHYENLDRFDKRIIYAYRRKKFQNVRILERRCSIVGIQFPLLCFLSYTAFTCIIGIRKRTFRI